MAKTKTKEYTIKFDRKPIPYEMVVVLKPFLPDKVRNEADAKIEKIISDQKGTIKVRDIWGKRYLAYEIEGHDEGYYVMYQFEAPGAGMEEIKKYMNRHSEILRYLILKKNTRENEEVKIKVKKTIVKKEKK